MSCDAKAGKWQFCLWQVKCNLPQDGDEDDNLDVNNDQSISKPYEGSKLTIKSSCVLTLQFKMRHQLTEQALAHLLHLVKLHSPQPNHCISLPYLLTKELHYPSILHYFCSACYETLETDTTPVCSNCNTILTPKGSVSSFIEIPLDLQLQTILERKYNIVLILK